MVADVVQNQVVTLGPFGEVLFRIIDDLIGAERADKLDVPRAARRRSRSAAQASLDDGKTWETNWVANFMRAGSPADA